MNKLKNSSQKNNSNQFKKLDPKNDIEANSQYYGEDYDISTQIVTNYYYNPNK